MKWLLSICFVLFLVACDGGGSSEPLQYPEESSAIESSAGSSSEMVSSLAECSSSEKSSSSEAILNSSSSVVSGSSAGLSSSAIVESSSSVGAVPCRTETEDNCEYGTLVDERDGQVYKTVKIGEQWWMAENLNYAYLQPTSTLDSSSWCYNDSAEYCEKFGRLYLWSAAIDSAGLFSDGTKGCGYYTTKGHLCPKTENVRGVCPEEWHVPSMNEYKKLIMMVGNHERLQATDKWPENSSNDPYGFGMLPVGYYDSPTDMFWDFGDLAYLWLANDDYMLYAKSASFDFIYPNSDVMSWEKVAAFSIRCVKD